MKSSRAKSFGIFSHLLLLGWMKVFDGAVSVKLPYRDAQMKILRALLLNEA
jgi:hypothetical protein